MDGGVQYMHPVDQLTSGQPQLAQVPERIERVLRALDVLDLE